MVRLQLKDIDKSYGPTHALCDFSFTFEPGIYALLGPNGSGKSTLMNIVSDNIPADGGTILFSKDGSPETDVREMNERFRQELGYLPQDPVFYPSFSVERFMWYMAALKRANGQLHGKAGRLAVSSQIDTLLRAVELDQVRRFPISSLSGGMKQRLGIAQAILGNPSVILLDEPTAGLDPKQRVNIRNYISKISQDRIVILATHIISDIEQSARDILILKNGILVDHGSSHELTQKMQGRVWIAQIPESRVDIMADRFRITGISQIGKPEEKMFSVRLIATEKPTEYALPEQPSLEDYYLDVFGDESDLSKSRQKTPTSASGGMNASSFL